MPIFEYTCRSCARQFEALVRGATLPKCPGCRSEDLEKRFSLPAVKSETTRGKVMRDAKRRDSRQARDRVNDQRNYELHHDD
jgi:putative FmdB family regulatory protein